MFDTASSEPSIDELAQKLGMSFAMDSDVSESEVSVDDEEDIPEEKLDPEQNKTRASFVTSGVSKAVLVSGGGLLLVVGAISFYNGVYNTATSKTTPQASVPQQQQQSEVDPQEQRIRDLQFAESQAKAQLALQTQQRELDQSEQGGSEAEDLPEVVVSSSPTPDTPPSSKPVPLATAAPTATSAPVQRQATPVQATPVPPQRAASPPTPPPSPAELEAEWQRLSTAGRYGIASPQVLAVRSSQVENILPAPSARRTEPSLVASSAPLPVVNAAPSLVQYLSRTAGVGGGSNRILAVGTTARAALDSDIVWTAEARSNNPPRFVVKLTSPVIQSGHVLLPEDALLIVTPVPMGSDARLVSLDVASVVIEGREYSIPAGSFSVRSRSGGSLVAKRERPGSTLARDVGLIGSSILAEVGSLLNRPLNSSSVTSSGTGGTTVVQSSTNPPPNYLGAALEGGFGTLSEILSERNESAIQEIMQSPAFFRLSRGTEVQLFINQTLAY